MRQLSRDGRAAATWAQLPWVEAPPMATTTNREKNEGSAMGAIPLMATSKYASSDGNRTGD